MVVLAAVVAAIEEAAELDLELASTSKAYKEEHGIGMPEPDSVKSIELALECSDNPALPSNEHL